MVLWINYYTTTENTWLEDVTRLQIHNHVMLNKDTQACTKLQYSVWRTNSRQTPWILSIFGMDTCIYFLTLNYNFSPFPACFSSRYHWLMGFYWNLLSVGYFFYCNFVSNWVSCSLQLLILEKRRQSSCYLSHCYILE